MLYGLRESLAMLSEEGLETCSAPRYLAGGHVPPRSRVEAQAVRGRAEVVLGYGLCDHGARGHQWCGRDFARVQALQPGVGRRLSKVAASCSVSAILAISTSSCCSARSRARNGDARCGREDRARQRRRRRAEILAQQFRRSSRGGAAKGQSGVTRRVVFLDRASLKATVRKPKHATEYVEYQKTGPEEIVPRIEGAEVAIVNKIRCVRRRSRSCRSSS